ncbi:MAG: tyrosine-type recombinase/integrase [Bryobacteraceae bacterium]
MSQRKRGNSEGSIYHMKDGRWRAAVTTGKDAEGRPKRKVFTAGTRHEVADQLTKALRDRQRGINIDPKKRTLADFLHTWLEGIKRDVAPATYVSYEGAVRLHIAPALGKILLAKMRPEDVQRFKAQTLDALIMKGPGVKKPAQGESIEGRHLSARTVHYLMLVLRMALNEACKLDLVSRNVAMLVDFPKSELSEIRPYSPEEATAFLDAAEGHRLGALFSAAMALGLRKGEALALKWPAVDLERGTLSVRLTLQRIKMPGEEKGQLLLKEPKRSSRRTVNLPPVIVSLLATWKSRQEQEQLLAGSRWRDDGFVFTTSIGTPLEPRNIERAFSEIITAAGLPRVRVHDLRHTAATLLLAQGVHPRVVMELLGHSQIAITMNIYSHVVPALRKDAADKMEAVLNPPKTGVATSVATKPPSGTIQ